MAFYLKRSFAALTPGIFLPLYKIFIRPYLDYAIKASHSTLSRDVEALKKMQKHPLQFVKGPLQVLYEATFQRLLLFPLSHVIGISPCSPSSPIQPSQDFAATPISSINRAVIPAITNTLTDCPCTQKHSYNPPIPTTHSLCTHDSTWKLTTTWPFYLVVYSSPYRSLYQEN